MGLCFLRLGPIFDQALQEPHLDATRVWNLTIAFFFVMMIVATQDIAVDGWAVSLLPQEQRALASTCQSIGINIGFYTSFTVFLALNSPSFSDAWIRPFLNLPLDSSQGFVSLGEYMVFWAWFMIIVSAFLAIFQKEDPNFDKEHLDVFRIYRDILRVIRLKSMRTLILALLTCRLGFLLADNVIMLKLQEKGFPREAVAISSLILFPLEIIFPIIIGNYARASPHKTLGPFLSGYFPRLFLAALGALLVWSLPQTNPLPLWAYISVFAFRMAYSLVMNMMFVSICAFFARIADESIGGTYMTLCNTINNLGNTWPKFFVFWLVEVLDSSVLDGFYAVAILCFLLGVLWYLILGRSLEQLQSLDLHVWSVSLEYLQDKKTSLKHSLTDSSSISESKNTSEADSLKIKDFKPKSKFDAVSSLKTTSKPETQKKRKSKSKAH
jgi:hypothetical protein